MRKNEFEVRDLRRKEKLFIDDDYVNGYAKYLDTFATAVYLSLCRHADKHQTCFPSVQRIAEQHNIDRKTVIARIKTLEEHNLIKKEKNRNSKGKFQHNRYYLIDKTEWKKYTVSRGRDMVTHVPPHPTTASRGKDISTSRGRDRKVSHIKDTHIREREITLLKKKNYTSLKDLTPSVLKEISDQYRVPPNFVENVREDLELYCESKGRRYVNYKAALMNWVKRDRARLLREQKLFSKKRGGVVDARKL